MDFLCGDAIRQSAFLRDGLTARPRQGNAFFRQYLIDSVHSIFSFAKTDIGRAMVNSLLDLLRFYAGSESRGGVALDLVHGLVGRSHHEDDQLTQFIGEFFLGVNFAVNEPLLDRCKFRVRHGQVLVSLPI